MISGDTSGISKLSKMSKWPKLYKLFKLTKLFRMAKIGKKGNVKSLAKVFLDKLKLNANIEKLIYFLLTFILWSHLSTCIWYFVAKMEDWSPDCWVVRLGYMDHSNWQIYVLSFYWTLTTVTTVGYGDISAGTTVERIYNLFIMSFGVWMYSFAIGSLSSIVANLDQSNQEINQKMAVLHSIKKEYRLDKKIYDKVRKVILYDLSRNQRDKKQFLQDLPNKLRIELSQIMHDRVIQDLNFFQGQPNDFFAYVAPLLKPVKFGQSDYLYKSEDMLNEMYFVTKGTIIFCLTEKYEEKEFEEIKKNNNFGEIEMCLNKKIRHNIKVKSRNCELFVLKKNDFLRLSVIFKDFFEKFMYRSLMFYLRYNKERKRLIKDYEELTYKIHNTVQIKTMKTGAELANSNINNSNSQNNTLDPTNSVNQVTKKKTTDTQKRRGSVNLSGTKLQLGNEIKDELNTQIKSDGETEIMQTKRDELETQADPRKENEMVHKNIENILEYLTSNGISFPDAEENPKMWLEKLKHEKDQGKQAEIVAHIEKILKDLYGK